MRFEERITILCGQALAADDDEQVQKILGELRLVLHYRIERLRSGLLAAYASSLIPQHASKDISSAVAVKQDCAEALPGKDTLNYRTWQQVVHEMACENDHRRALRLSHELSRLLQRAAEASGSD